MSFDYDSNGMFMSDPKFNEPLSLNEFDLSDSL